MSVAVPDAGADAGHPAVPHPAPQRRQVGRTLLSLAVLAAPAAWSLEVLVNLSVSSLACYPKDHPLASPASLGAWPALAGVQALVFAIGIAGVLASLVCWRRTRGEAHGGVLTLVEVGEGRTRFLAMCSVLLSVVFVVAMVFTGMAFVMVRLC